jgi:Protein of unknown function (DUF2961)/Carbohydrate esterase, sialic acid-specific acetylesterase
MTQINYSISLIVFICLSFIALGNPANSTAPKSPATQTALLRVYILAGQSNAVGYNHIKELHDYKKYLTEDTCKLSTILFWPGSNARQGFENRWTKLQPGVSDISVDEPYKNGSFGPEIGFALTHQKLHPGEKIAIIKYAEGGTGIARSKDYTDYIPALKDFDDKGRNWYPSSEEKKPGLLYTNLINNIKNALTDLKNQKIKFEVAGFLWMQGEHEAGISKTMAEDYGKLFSLFRESVRRDLNLKKLPFIVGEINSHTWAFAEIARKGQTAACSMDPQSQLVKTMDLPRGSIGGAAHFDADGMMILGNRFAQAANTFADKKKQDHKSAPITFKTLLEELTNRSSVAQWPAPEFRLLQASSYDRRSVEKDKEGWFANEDWSNYIRKEINNGREEYVLMDADGPGAITRFWVAGHPNQKNQLRFYIDGEETPFWEADHTGALIGQNKAIGTPLSQRSVDHDSLNTNYGAQPGHNLFAPLPFSKHLKITSDVPKGDAGKGFWYNINYRLYDANVNVESFSKETPTKYADILMKTNQQLSGFMELTPLSTLTQHGKNIKHQNFSLKPSSSKEMTILQPGAIKRIYLSLKADKMDNALKNTRIQLDFDGQNTVDVPVGFFFGSGDQLLNAKDWYRKVDDKGNMVCYWVMPYRQNAVIRILNKGEQIITATLDVATDHWQWDERSMYFHADYKKLHEMPAKTNKDFNFIDLRDQQGVYVGDILQVYKNFRGWWGEGDEKIYIDGATFPDHFGTGSEDYYGYAWGHPETFNNIFNSQPIGDANTGEKGTTVNSRVRGLDAIPFKNSLRFDMESWQMNGGAVNYALATFWYGK